MADEDADFADVEVVYGIEFGQVHDDKQRVAVLLDFWPLMAVQGIFDRQFVQVEFLLHFQHLDFGRVAQGDPDEAVRPFKIVADVGNRDVSEFFSFLIGDAINQHGASTFVLFGYFGGRGGLSCHTLRCGGIQFGAGCPGIPASKA